MALEWGVYPVLAGDSATTDEVIDESIASALEAGYVEEGDLVVLTAGVPVGLSGTTNLIKVHSIGKVLLHGAGIGDMVGTGRICIANNYDELLSRFKDGDIIVSLATDRDMVSFIKRSSGIITVEGGLTSHGAIVGLNLGKPTIVGAKDALDILKNGDIVTMDSSTGQVYKGETRV